MQIIEQIRGEFISPELRTAYFSTRQDYYEVYIDVRMRREGLDVELALAGAKA